LRTYLRGPLKTNIMCDQKLNTGNKKTWDKKDIIKFYEDYHQLQPPEESILHKLINEGCGSILDIGVGAGRTTPFIALSILE